MSVFRMSNFAAQQATNPVQRVRASSGGPESEGPGETDGKGPTKGSGTADQGGKGLEGALDKISAYIPSEVIGVYIAVTGILVPTTASSKWIIFGLALALIPILTLLGNALAKKKKLTPPDARATIYVIALAAVAFCAWAAALPDSPLATFSDKASQIGGAAVIVLAALLPKVAELIGVSPKP